MALATSQFFTSSKNRFITSSWMDLTAGNQMWATLVENGSSAGQWNSTAGMDQFNDITTAALLTTGGSVVIPAGERTLAGTGAFDINNTGGTVFSSANGGDVNSVVLTTGASATSIAGTDYMLCFLTLSSTVTANTGDIILTWGGAPNYVFRL